MNKKGFTLTEILAVLVILGVVMVIAIPSVSNLQDKFKARYYEKLDDTVISAAKTYFKDNKDKVPKQDVGATALSLNGLVTKKYLESIYPYNNKTDQCKGYVVLLKVKEQNQYYSCMYCKVGDDYLYKSPELDDSKTKSMCLLLSSEERFGGNDTVSIPASSVGDDNSVVYIYYDTDPNYLKKNLAIRSSVRLLDPKTEDELAVIPVSDAIYPENITTASSQVTNGHTACETGTCNSIDDPKLKYIDSSERSYFLYQYPAPIVSGTAGTSIEVGVTTVKLTAPLITFVDAGDTKGTFPRKNGGTDPVRFKEFQYTRDGGYSWKNFCDDYDCSRTLDSGVFSASEKIKFRMVIEDDSGIHYSRETAEYTIAGPAAVSFVSTCGTVVGNTNYNTSSAYGTLPDLNADPGYTFIGWFDGNTQVGPTSMPSSSKVTLVGKCSANTYTVTLDSNGGTAVSPNTLTVTYDQRYPALPTPTYANHTFKGWYTARTGGTSVTSNTTVKTASNHTLYAHWEADPDDLVLDANGGTVSALPTKTIQVRDQQVMTSITRPTRSGYEFIGWFSSEWKDNPLGWYASEHASELSGADYSTIYNHMLNNTGNRRSQYTAADKYIKGTTPTTLYAGWYMSTQEVTSSCRKITLETGIYYVEIVGGGAGALGCGFSDLGGHAARWAGYLNISAGTYNFCPGAGSSEVYGCLSSNYPANGGDSYIGASASNYIIKADGGKNAQNQPYTNAIMRFASNNPIKKECKNLTGSNDRGLLGYLVPIYNIYGYGGGVEPGRIKHGYDGTNGVIYISHVSSSPSTWTAPSTCPQTICPNEASGNVKGCKWGS